MAKHKNSEFDLEDIYKRYFNNDESIYKISKIYSVTSKVIKRIIQENFPNEELRNCSQAQKIYFKTHDSPMKNKHHTEESKQKMSKNQTWQKGENNPAWKGGIRISPDGYVLIYKPNHPFTYKDTYVMPEHRIIIEEYLRINDPNSKYLILIEGKENKFLDPQIVVHHINGKKKDNRIKNLQIIENQSIHAKMHFDNPFLNLITRQICYEDILERIDKNKKINIYNLAKHFKIDSRSINKRLKEPERYSRRNLEIVLDKNNIEEGIIICK